MADISAAVATAVTRSETDALTLTDKLLNYGEGGAADGTAVGSGECS